jgi:hypothetical protein
VKGEGLIVVAVCLYVGDYLFPSSNGVPRAVSIEWRRPGKVARIFRWGDGPLNLAKVVVQLDGIALAVVGLIEVASPGTLVRSFGYDYAALGLAIAVGMPVGWAALAIWRTRYHAG